MWMWFVKRVRPIISHGFFSFSLRFRSSFGNMSKDILIEKKNKKQNPEDLNDLKDADMLAIQSRGHRLWWRRNINLSVSCRKLHSLVVVFKTSLKFRSEWFKSKGRTCVGHPFSNLVCFSLFQDCNLCQELVTVH